MLYDDPAAESPVDTVSTSPSTVVLIKSISNSWLRKGTISLESGIDVTLIILEDAPSTLDIVMILILK